MAPETFRLLVVREGSGGLHLHAKAFDVDADSELAYEWRIVGTTNVLLIQTIGGTSLAVYEESTPIYPWKPVWYYESVEGVPATVKTNVFTKAEVEGFPQDDEGNYLYIEAYTNQQVVAETWTVTNVLKTAEIRSAPLTDMQMIDWAPLLFDDEQNERFLVSDTTLMGSDPVFADAEDGVLYFAMLTVTDKDGGVWNSLETSSGCFFAFATGPAVVPPQPSTAVYSAVFTAMSPTNVAFVVTLVSGEPADNDTVTLESAPDFVAGPWTKVKKYTIGNRLSTTSEPTEVHRSFPVDFTAEDMSACDSLGQKFTPSLAWGTNDALPLAWPQVSIVANDYSGTFTDNEKAAAQRILSQLGTIFSDRYTNLPGITSDDLSDLKVRVVSQSEIDVIYPSTKTVASTDPLEYRFSPSQNILFFRVVQP